MTRFDLYTTNIQRKLSSLMQVCLPSAESSGQLLAKHRRELQAKKEYAKETKELIELEQCIAEVYNYFEVTYKLLQRKLIDGDLYFDSFAGNVTAAATVLETVVGDMNADVGTAFDFSPLRDFAQAAQHHIAKAKSAAKVVPEG